jgi:hypothetical protein
MKLEALSLVLRLDCLFCVLTVFRRFWLGRCWEGWAALAANSLIICVIGLRTAQLGFTVAQQCASCSRSKGMGVRAGSSNY